MRQWFKPGIRRASAVVMAAALILSLAAPAAAYALYVPTPTISISTTSMTYASTFRLAGTISRTAAGKILVVEVKKPGSLRWSYSSARVITSTGFWMYRYLPRLKGVYYFRARYTTRYGTRYSSIKSMWLKTQPVWDLYVASTTSTTDSGLFDTIIPLFEHQYPYWRVKVLSLGSGPAIRTAYDSASDMLLTHEPIQEAQAVTDGVIRDRHSLMFNDFLLVGPSSDPAGIRVGTVASNDIVTAFTRIRNTSSIYVTRTGTSGTAVKNTTIWGMTAGGVPTSADTWYKGTTLGMGQALNLANNQSPIAGYILTDRATWLNVNPSGLKTVMCERDPSGILKNPYSVSLVVRPKGNAAGAVDFSNWLRGPVGQGTIANFGMYRFGQALFTPWVPPAAGAY